MSQINESTESNCKLRGGGNAHSTRIDTAIIIDDHPMAMLALETLLNKNGIDVINKCGQGEEGLGQLLKMRPDIAIIDIDMPGISGLEVIGSARLAGLDSILIAFSAKNDVFYGKKCLATGANGFVSKKNGIDNIIGAINAARNGYSYFPFILNSFVGHISSEETKIESLSEQEVRVLHYLLKGMSIGTMAQTMKINVKTVSTYKFRLMQKLDCSSLIELVNFAARNNIT
jgi:two-component system response regulator EvgA